MKKPSFQTLVLALILSAFTQHASAQKPDSTFNPSTYQWEPIQKNHPPNPNIDSIAIEVLINGLAVWDEPENFEPFGFKKLGNPSISSLLAINKRTLVQIDKFNDTIASVSLLYSGWGGYWNYQKDQEGYWSQVDVDYSDKNVPDIDTLINPMLWGLYTARLKSELTWLQGSEFAGILDSLNNITESMKQQGEKVRSIWGTEGDYNPNFAYEFSQDTINNVLQTLCNFAKRMVDTTQAKKSGAELKYFVVEARKIKGTILLKENGEYDMAMEKTQVSDTTFIITWGNITLMPQPFEMEKITKASWMLQFFFPGDIGVLVSLENEITTPGVIFFSGMDHIGTYVNNDWTAEDPNYNIGDLQKIFLDCQSLLPKQ